MLLVVRRRPTRPAACHVVPPASWFCSSRTTSFQPSLARWYAILHPTMPPPTMTTLVSLLTLEYLVQLAFRAREPKDYDCRRRQNGLPYRVLGAMRRVQR